MNVRTDYRRSAWYDGLRLRPGYDNVISQRDGEKHAALRTKMTAGVREDQIPLSSIVAKVINSTPARRMTTWNIQSILISQRS